MLHIHHINGVQDIDNHETNCSLFQVLGKKKFSFYLFSYDCFFIQMYREKKYKTKSHFSQKRMRNGSVAIEFNCTILKLELKVKQQTTR